MDFFKKYNCQLDCTQTCDSLILRPNNLNYPIHLPIIHTCDNNATILPARSEVVRQIKISTPENNILVINQEIDKEIFVANTISDD